MKTLSKDQKIRRIADSIEVYLGYEALIYDYSSDRFNLEPELMMEFDLIKKLAGDICPLHLINLFSENKKTYYEYAQNHIS